MSDQCPAQTEGASPDLMCNWPDGHAGNQHWDEAGKLLWEQPPEVPSVPPYRAHGVTIFRKAVSDLHMAGIRTGADYERIVSEIVASIYAPPQKPAVVSDELWDPAEHPIRAQQW